LQPESPRAEGVRSLEVRWIFPGQLAAALTGWFGRFPAEMTVVEDAYLLDPHLPGLSVKMRGRRALEVKVYRGSPGLLEVAGRARGRLESWQKWSFPHGPLSHDPAGWMPVTKRRRISWFTQTAGVRVPRLDEEPGCAVELTEVDAGGKAWWTLGFEATGPVNLLRGEMAATAALMFAQSPPGGIKPGTDNSKSYAEWLRRLASDDLDAGA
jgi:hypothetical protein